MTNPPFGGGQYDRQEGLEQLRRDDLATTAGWSWSAGNFADRRSLRRADPAVLFWDFNLSLLRPGGVLGIVLPDGALGPKYTWLHDALLRGVDGRVPKAELLAVVSLPRQTFALSGTAAKTSFLVLRRLPVDIPNGSVLLARSEHVGYLQRGSRLQADPAGNDLAEIARVFVSRPESASSEGRCAFVPASELVDSTTHWPLLEEVRLVCRGRGMLRGRAAVASGVAIVPTTSSSRFCMLTSSAGSIGRPPPRTYPRRLGANVSRETCSSRA